MISEGNGSSANGQDEYTFQFESITTNLDPELQKILIDLRAGQLVDPSLREDLLSGKIVVDVVAKLANPNTEVPGFNVVQKIGPIVTGTVDANVIDKVRQNRNVISLKAARKLRRMLSNSVPEIRASRQQILARFASDFDPGSFGVVDGSGVIIGIIDTGCDVSHPHFRRANGDTRILYLWDQRHGLTKESPTGYGYGREFTAEAINRALKENPAAPHTVLGYDPVRDGGAAHGTRVMDIAAGGGSGDNPPGVAPKADIIFVDSMLDYALEDDQSFGNSRHLLEAVKYVFDKAEQLNKRAVVNLSLNYDCGPHDGSAPVEEGFDLLLEVPGRAIVVAAGNSRQRRLHVRKTIHPRTPSMIGWELFPNDTTPNRMSLWYTGKRKLELSLISPRKQVLGPFPLNTTATIYRNGVRAAQVFHRINDSTNGDNHLLLVFQTLMEEGIWRLVLKPADNGFFIPFDVHAWIEAENKGTQSRVMYGEEDDSYTIGSLSCGHSVIAVGSYDALNPAIMETRSGEGPTRDGRQKPDVSAPGLHVRAAVSLTGTVGEDGGGTSNAAPHVAGLIALLMQDAPRALTIEETRALVMNSARHEPPSGQSVWDPRYGRGRVNAAEALILQKSLPLTPTLKLRHRLVTVPHSLALLAEADRLERFRDDKTSALRFFKFNNGAAVGLAASLFTASEFSPVALRASITAADLSPTEVSQPPASKGHVRSEMRVNNPNGREPELELAARIAASFRPNIERRNPMSSTEVVEKAALSKEVAHEASSNSVLFHDGPGGGGVTHTPIIVTDGSASLEFAESEYSPDPRDPTLRISSGLHLVKVSAHRNHDRATNSESQGRICFPLVGNEVYEIEFTCAREGQPVSNFTIGGGPAVSPRIRFSHGSGKEYQRTADFPSIDLGQRFGNLLRNIVRMQIFRIENGSRQQVHDCGLVENGCEYRLLDIH